MYSLAEWRSSSKGIRSERNELYLGVTSGLQFKNGAQWTTGHYVVWLQLPKIYILFCDTNISIFIKFVYLYIAYVVFFSFSVCFFFVWPPMPLPHPKINEQKSHLFSLHIRNVIYIYLISTFNLHLNVYFRIYCIKYSVRL